MSEPPNQPVPAQPVVLSYGSPEVAPERPILPMAERAIHFCTTVLLPIVCFAFSAQHYQPGPEWQRGEWFDYLGIIPSIEGWPFYFLLLLSMYAAARTVINPQRAINLLYVRAGLFSGVLLAWQYSFIHVVNISHNSPALGVPLGLGLPLLLVAGLMFARWAADQLIWRRAWYRDRPLLIWACAAVLLIATPLVTGFAGYFAALFGVLLAAPGLTMFSFVVLSIAAVRRGQPLQDRTGPIVAWVVGWLLAFGAAWVKSYANAIDAYAKLPTTNPNCYIATAASGGHRRFVGRRRVNGCELTPQLAMLKAGELAIAARRPAMHRTIRRIYNTLGPPVARRIRNPFTADLVYVTLKPFEWAAAFYLARLAGK